MQNFSSEFKTPEQYIIDITYRIWEETGVGRINDWYAADCPRRSPHGVTTTAAEVIRETLETIAIYPDGEILAEDVIIGDKPSGFYSSHRVRHPATHMGDSAHIPATRRRVTSLVIADCLCRDNRIVEEWELSDNAGAVRQLGLDPVAYGRSLGERYPAHYGIGNEAMRHRWRDDQGLTLVGDKDIAQRIIDTYSAVWNDKNLSVLSERYDRAVRFEGPDGRLMYGRSDLNRALMNLLAAIPDGNFEPHHVIVCQEPKRPERVALRWSYCGTHAGRGCYGEPTHAPVAILGISHFELRDGMIAREWLVADETSIYAQIAAHTMTKAGA